MRAKPHTMFIAQSGLHLEEVAVVDDLGDDLLHVVRLVRRVGDEVDDAVARAVGVVVGLEVRRVLEVVRRQERQQVAHLLEARSARRRHTNVATPDFVACVIAPPSSSCVTSSPVTVFTTSGPVMNMCDVPFTMKMKSVIAGE